jgi:hypothetical protein
MRFLSVAALVCLYSRASSLSSAAFHQIRRARRLSAFAGAALLCLGAAGADAQASLTSFTLSITSATTINQGQSVTITAVVTGDSTDGTPTGPLEFFVWNALSSPASRTALCSGTRVTNGLTSTYTCSTTSLGGGYWNFFAEYYGEDTPYQNSVVQGASNGPLTVIGPTFTVNTLADSTDSPDNCATTGTGTQCSLRDALNDTNVNNQGGTINFQSGLTGTITLGSSLPGSSGEMVTINGPGPNMLTISGAGQYSVFYFDGDSYSVAISGLTIEDGLITSNGVGGGAIGLYSNYSLTVNNCAFIGNQSSKNSGGAIYNGDGYGGPGAGMTVSNSTFIGNSALYGGGAIFVGGGPLTVTNSTFSGNTSDTGGAIYSYGGTIANSTFNGNSATNGTSGLGGAIESVSGSLVANNDIFSNNTALQYGAGIELYGSTLSASNNVFYNNLDGGTTEEDCNIFGTGTCTGSSVPPENGNVEAGSNPLTLPLGNYGGVAETYLPQPGSAAICAGSASLAVDASSNPLSTDERGWAMSPGYWQCASGSVDAGAVQTNYIQVQYSGDGSDAYCNPNNYCTLRAAVQTVDAAGYGDISFSSNITLPATINIGRPASGQGSTLGIIGQVNIVGPGANQLTISGDDDMSMGTVLSVSSGAQLFLDGLTISAGYQNSGSGGGINNQGTLNVLDSAISGNVAANGASGAGISSSGTLSLTDSTVSGNQITYGSGSGGGIYSSGTLTLIESTVANNSLSFQSTGGGGGIFISSGSATLTASTVSGNSAPQLCPGGPSCIGGSGGGIYNGGTLTATNSIVAGNTAGNDNDAVGAFEAASADNLIGDGSGTSGITNGADGNMVGTSGTPVNAMVSGLLGNAINAMLSTMIPLPGSPAICAGELTNIPAGITTDERGYPLVPTDGYCPSGFVDIGAVQTNYTSAAFVQQPTNTLVNTAISPDPTVAVYETDTLLSTNNTDGVSGVPVTLAYSDSANITGTLTETTVGGVADFSGLTPTALETGVNFSFSLPVYSSTSFAGTSNNFEVIGPVSQLVVSAPSSVTAGQSFQFTVTAEDSAGNIITGFSDTLSFYSSDFGSGLVLPVSGTLVNGVGTFNATLVTEGNKTLGATDTALSITGSTSVSVNSAAAMSLQVTGYPSTWYAGATAQVYIYEADQYGNEVPTFAGPVTVSTSDSAAVVTQYTPYTSGEVAYSVVFGTQGTQSINVTAAGVTGGSEMEISIGPMPSFVVTVSTDKTDGLDTAADCTNQSLGGATPDSSCSLRDAIWAANYIGAGNVTFLPSDFSAATTITLASPTDSNEYFGAIDLGANVTVTGPTKLGANLVTISGATPASPATGSAIFDVYGYPANPSLNLDGPDTIANLNITNGNGTATNGDDSGTGGINVEADLTVTNCSFTSNLGDEAGAIYNYEGNLTISGSTFSYNGTTGLGAGPDSAAIFTDTSSGTPKFAKDRPLAMGRTIGPLASAGALSSAAGTKPGFFGTALGGRAGFANRVRPMGGRKSATLADGHTEPLGGIHSLSAAGESALVRPLASSSTELSSPTLTVTNSTFSDNGGYDAGAIFNDEDQVIISGSTFTNNGAPDGGGALVVDEDGYTAVNNSTFSGNTGGFGGVVFAVEFGEAEIVASTMNSNTSTGPSSSGIPIQDGGAVTAVEYGSVLLGYDTIYNNSSTSGFGAGAIADLGAEEGFVAGFNLTVTGNSGFYGAMLDDSGGSESDIENTIASGNITTDPNAATDGASPDSNGMALYVGDVVTSPGINLAPLYNYGGPTQTLIPLPGSTAICAGSVEGLYDATTDYDLTFTMDQRGDPNFTSTYPNTGGNCMDAGAVQTDYAIGFTTQPPSGAEEGVALNPAPAVSLTESGTLFAANAGTVTMTDSAKLLTGTLSETLASGVASFGNLVISTSTTGDTLNALLALTPTINLTAQASQSISVSGGVTLSTTGLSFPSTDVGSTSMLPVTVTNSGTTNLTVNEIGNSGTNPTNFSHTSNCGGHPITPGNYCTIEVYFTPPAAGPYSATLNITDNGFGTPQTVTLSGSGTAPTVTLSTTGLSFPSTNAGTTSTLPVTVTNSGATNLTVSVIGNSGTNPTSFSHTSNCGGYQITPGNYCTIEVNFTPAAEGPYSATLNITDNATGSPQTVTLSGNGIAPTVTLSTTGLSFPSTDVGTTSTLPVTVTNSGTTNLTVSAIGNGGTDPTNFSHTSNCGGHVIAPGDYCTIQVTFSPSAVGPFTATLNITDNALGSPQTVTLNGVGFAPTVTLSTTGLSFPATKVGSTSTLPVTVTNSGTTNLTVSVISNSGTNPTDFSHTSNCGGHAITPGNYCTIEVIFTPGATGPLSATLNITDNATGSPQAVTLNGDGQ